MEVVTLVTVPAAEESHKTRSWELPTRTFNLLYGWWSDIVIKMSQLTLVKKEKENFFKSCLNTFCRKMFSLLSQRNKPKSLFQKRLEGKKDYFDTSKQRQHVNIRKFNILINASIVLLPSKIAWRKLWHLAWQDKSKPGNIWMSQRVQLWYFCLPWCYCKWGFWQCLFAHHQCKVHYPL